MYKTGTMNFAGKQLVKMELRMFLSRLALNFDITYAEKEIGEHFESTQRNTFTLTLPPLYLMLTYRNA